MNKKLAAAFEKAADSWLRAAQYCEEHAEWDDNRGFCCGPHYEERAEMLVRVARAVRDGDVKAVEDALAVWFCKHGVPEWLVCEQCWQPRGKVAVVCQR